MKKEMIEKILKDIEEGYDLMADKFSETRKFFWRDLGFIKNYISDGDCLLDFGCGNGRLLELLGKKNVTYFGVDVSQKLLDIAEKKYAKPSVDFQKISGFGSVPFEGDFFNAVCAIAVLHHIPSDALRLKMAKEMYRVLKPGGFLIVTTWNLWRTKHFESVIRGWAQSLCGRSDLGFNDCYIPFNDNEGKIFYRYHHAFRARELRDIFKKAGFLVKEAKIFKQRNIILVCRK
jgi:ubiquinone/menaquinone biosynthesis C-methylase UbiE